MLSLRSLAFILCSAIRRARALSCAALRSFPNIKNGRQMATNNETKMATAAPMCSLRRTVYASKAITARGSKDPFERHFCIDIPVIIVSLLVPISTPAFSSTDY